MSNILEEIRKHEKVEAKLRRRQIRLRRLRRLPKAVLVFATTTLSFIVAFAGIATVADALWTDLIYGSPANSLAFLAMVSSLVGFVTAFGYCLERIGPLEVVRLRKPGLSIHNILPKDSEQEVGETTMLILMVWSITGLFALFGIGAFGLVALFKAIG